LLCSFPFSGQRMMQRTGRSAQRQRRLNDFALYVAISTIVIAYAMACTIAGLSFGWIILPLQALLVFGYFIAKSRRFWSRAFWAFTGILFLIHLAIVPAIFLAHNARVNHGMGFWFGVGTFAEIAIFLIIRERTLPKLKKAFARD
jgi:hypothetical protein